MEPQEIMGANIRFDAPAKWDEEKYGPCAALAIKMVPTPGSRLPPGEQPTLKSAWLPTSDELVLLNQGHALELTVYGSMHPPVSLAPTEHRYQVSDVREQFARLLHPHLDTGDSRTAPAWAVKMALLLDEVPAAVHPNQVPLSLDGHATSEDLVPGSDDLSELEGADGAWPNEEGVSNGAGEQP